MTDSFIFSDTNFDAFENKEKKVAEQVKCFGNSLSVALLDSNCKIFSSSNLEGIIGYQAPGSCAVVFGDPVSPPQDQQLLAKDFHHFCQEHNKSILYIAASAKFAHFAQETGLCPCLIEVGEELILNPQNDFLAGSQGRKLRTKVNQSLHAQTEIFEYLLPHPTLKQAIENVARQWLEARRGPQLFLAHVDLFANPEGKRWFYALREGEVVGVALLNALEAHEGFALNLLMTTEKASPGTSEHLMSHVLQVMKKEECKYFTVGFVPADVLGEIQGFGPMYCWLLRKIYKLCKKIFHLEGRKGYWKKFHPRTESRYVLFSEKKLKISDVKGLFLALNLSI